MKNILLTGVNPGLIPGIQSMARSTAGEWAVGFAADAQSAADLIGRVRVDLLIVDINYPDIQGINLLTQTQKLDSRMVRIAICDQRNIIDHLRAAGLAQQFLNKTYDLPTLKSSIERGLALGDLLRESMLQRLIPQVRSLPSLPNLYLQIADEMNKSIPSADRVGQIIAQDVGMTARILQLVNSAHFGLPYQVANPTQATVLLGLETVRDLVLTINVFSNYDQLKLRHLGLTRLWNHSIAVGVNARSIARQITRNKQITDFAFVAGLLHDVGKLVLGDNLPMKYRNAQELAAQRGIPIASAEKEIFGASHAQVGAYLMWLWNLPEPVVTALAYHQNPAEHPQAAFSPLIAVHLGNIFSHELEIGRQKKENLPIDQDSLARLGLLERVDELRELCT